MTTLQMVGRIMKIALPQGGWFVNIRYFGVMQTEANLSVVTEEPLSPEVKALIKDWIYQYTPAWYGIHLTFVRKKKP